MRSLATMRTLGPGETARVHGAYYFWGGLWSLGRISRLYLLDAAVQYVLAFL